MNTFGTLLRLTTFGESHGPAMGGILDGMPPMVHIDFGEVESMLARRRPGGTPCVSQRKEPDKPEFLSGISPDGFTLGTPIGFIVRNTDAVGKDYSGISECIRPNHADYLYERKYGICDVRGGGRASARETVNWVVAGALAIQWLKTEGIEVRARFKETNNVAETLGKADSTGGIVEGVINGLPECLGEPVFDKFHSRLAAAMMGINAAKAFEYGDGTESARSYGSCFLDTPYMDAGGRVRYSSNHCGGVQGGLTNGMPVNFKVYFKPAPTLPRKVGTIGKDGTPYVLEAAGRHDPCVAIRAVPVVEALAALVTADMMKLSGK